MIVKWPVNLDLRNKLIFNTLDITENVMSNEVFFSFWNNNGILTTTILVLNERTVFITNYEHQSLMFQNNGAVCSAS